VAGNGDSSGGGNNSDHTVPSSGTMLVLLELFRVPAPQRAGRASS
jgi:hypothetical protein